MMDICSISPMRSWVRALCLLGVLVLNLVEPVGAATEKETGATASADASIVLPPLTVDAERSTYQALISRPQDEITPEMIRHRPTSNPVDLLRSLNSSITTSHSLLGAILTPELRGFDGKHTKILVDGCPVNTPWNGASSLSGFPLRRLQKVTLVPGGTSLVYGPNGMAGAVNLTLPTARDLEGLTLLQEVAGGGSQHQELLYGRVAHNNEHLVGLFLDDVRGSRKYKSYGSGDLRSDNMMFMYRGRVETDAGWVFKATVLKSDGTLSIPNYKERFEPWQMAHRDFVVEKDFGDDRNLILRYATYMDFSSTQYFTGYDLVAASGPINTGEDVTLRMKTAEVLYNFPLGKCHHLTIGGQRQDVKDIGHTVKAKANNTWLETKGYFLSDSITPNDRLSFHLVGRSDESFESDVESTWSVAGDYKLTSRSSIGVGVSRTVRFPNVQELYRGNRVFGNELLEPEKADNREFRFAHRLNENWKASVTRFDSEIEKKITSIIAAGNITVAGVGKVNKNDSYYVNIDEAKISGWEFGINGLFNDRFDGWLNYTRLDDAEDTKNHLRLVSKPEFRMAGGVLFHRGRSSAMLTCEHQGKIPATRTLDSAGAATVYGGVDSSTCFDLNLRRRLPQECAIYLNIENLTDQDDVVLIQASDARNKAGLLQDPIYYRSGRKAVVGVELSF